MNMDGAYVAGQGGFWTTGVRVHGYRDGTEINATSWFTNIGSTPIWFDMSALADVDRIVFESIPVFEGGGYFGMDNLTFTAIPEPAAPAVLMFAVFSCSDGGTARAVGLDEG